MKKIKALNTVLTLLMIATSFFGIIHPQENLKLPKTSENTQTVDTINATHLNTPLGIYIKTAKSDLNDPQFWERSNNGNTIGFGLCTFFLPKLLDSPLSNEILINAVLGWGFSILPYLFEKNCLNLDSMSHIANHLLLQLIQSSLYYSVINKKVEKISAVPFFFYLLKTTYQTYLL